MVHSNPESITRDDLDVHLEKGWFRFGGTMRTTRFTVWEERHLRSTIWTRTDIDGLKWSRSNRRLLRRVRDRFDIRVQPVQLDLEHEELYRDYCSHVGGERPANLVDFLGGEPAMLSYATQEVSIRHEGRLVGFSLFDAGHTSVMSLLGAFHPDYSRQSLGMASMLLEVEHARQHNMRWHYSGYILPGEPRMDYKLRVGAMHFLHPDSSSWQPIDVLEHTVLPDQRMRNALERVGRALGRSGVRCRRMLNPLFELAESPVISERMVSEPMLIMVNSDKAPFPIITWNDIDYIYELWKGLPAVIRHRRSWDGPEKSTGTALIQEEVGRYRTAAEVTDAVIKALA